MAGIDSEIQLVTFQLGNEIYGIDIMDVKEIVKIQEIRPIPNAPSYVAGILNLRGNIIPIINLHVRFNLKKPDLSEEDKLLSGIIIIDVDNMQIGIIIDKVAKVMTVEVDSIQQPPQLISGIGAEYIQGVVNEDGRYLIILDIRRLFSKKELKQLGEISQ